MTETNKRPSRLVSVSAWIIYLFLIVPSLIVIPMSFSNSTELVFPPKVWGLDLYQKMLDPGEGWLSAILRSTEVALVTAVCALVLGVLATYALERSEFRGKKTIEFLFISPIFVPSIVLALALYLCFSYLGLAGSFIGLVVSHIIVTVPFVILTARAGMKQIDVGIETVAAVMGASKWQIFRKVVLPLLKPSLLSAGFFSFLLSFDEVVIAWFVGASVNPTLPVKMYSSLQWEISPVLAAISSLLLLITCVICIAVALTRKNAPS